jgi:hypothetical protein
MSRLLPIAFACCLVVQTASSQTAEDAAVLNLPEVAQALAPLATPSLDNAVAVVRELDALAAKQNPAGQVALKRFGAVIKNLFIAAKAITDAQQGIEAAELAAREKDMRAQQSAQVNSLGSRNMTTAINLAKEAAAIRSNAAKLVETRRAQLGSQIAGANTAAAAYQSANAMTAAVAVTVCMLALHDQYLPQSPITPAVSRRSVQLAMLPRDQQTLAQDAAKLRLADAMAAEMAARRAGSDDFLSAARQIGVEWLLDTGFEAELETLFFDFAPEQRKVIAIIWHNIAKQKLSIKDFKTTVTLDSIAKAFPTKGWDPIKIDLIARKSLQVLNLAADKGAR